jgi:diketogulonate reductase-like aldo/keto reductase
VATLPESVDYTDKDFDAIRARLIALIQSVFPDWTDFEVASFGNLLVEVYAYVGDVLTFYQDNLAREVRLATATQRKSVMALAKMLGCRLHGAQAALRWTLMFEAVSCAIPGAKTPQQARDNAAAADLPPLPPEAMAGVRAVYDERLRPLVHASW